MRAALLIILFACGARVIAQQFPVGLRVSKEVEAVRTSAGISMDGVLDEADWVRAPIASGFIQYEPRPNVPATMDTEVRLLYDDAALYVGAFMLDPAVDSLQYRLTLRDDVDISDWFDLVLDPYRSGRNGFEFLVSAANVQTDMLVVDEGEDESWNVVWESAVGLTPDGWVVELRIPFSAIRFPKAEVQQWNINFIRHVGRTREKSFWSPLDPEQSGWMRQCGACMGISNVRPPLRLMLYPYAAAYAEHYPYGIEGVSNWTRSFNGGMDVKFGLSDAYTVDMTLVPDFGQVVADNVVLNLSPFEVQFNENRQFFIEGVELFQRGGLFYSRRIGGEPILYGGVDDQLSDGETVVENPSASQLINATKISGRGRKGLGLGFFNAITSPTHATLRDSLGNERELLTDPLTNYSVLVADQLLPNNSYVSLTNTNVLRDGHHYDANASALEFTVNNKRQNFRAAGDAKITQQFAHGIDRDPGYNWGLGTHKTGGAWNYGLDYREVDANYDPNDLGIYFFTNIRSVEQYVKYTEYQPKGRWQRWNIYFQSEYIRVLEPDHFFNFAMELGTFRVTKSFLGFGGHVRAEPIVTYDPYEARVPGRLYAFPTNIQFGGFVSTDYSKRLAFDLNAGLRTFDDGARKRMWAGFEPQWRASDRLFINLGAEHSFIDQDVGWVAFDGDDIILGRRDLWTTETGLEARYIFNNRMGLSLRARHYWSRAIYVDFHMLDEEGILQPTDHSGMDEEGEPVHDVDFDAFNVDLIYTWNFAPGSQLTVAWKNLIYTSDNRITEDHFENLANTLDAPQTNRFSLKVLYFIDALRFRRRDRGE